MTEIEPYMSIQHVADLVDVSVDTIERAIELGKSSTAGIQAQKVGRQWRVKPSDVETWLTKGGRTFPKIQKTRK